MSNLSIFGIINTTYISLKKKKKYNTVTHISILLYFLLHLFPKSLKDHLFSVVLLLLSSCAFQTMSTISAANKRWRLAFISIDCSRALLSFFKDSLIEKKTAKVPKPDNRFKIDQTTLTELVKEKNADKLQNFGGVDGVASTLGTSVECWIHGDVADITRRHEAFGSNTYKRPPTKSFFYFVVEDFKDLTILICLVSAASSLTFGIKKHGIIKEGWYEGGRLLVALFLVVVISAISNLWQSRQLTKLSEICNNIQIDAVGVRKRQKVSIFEIVVGDVICLKIGDHVPADGLFLDGHSLQVDESIITGKSDHVPINCSLPFLFSGTNVHG
jgi:Ca2+-transporting ATPase